MEKPPYKMDRTNHCVSPVVGADQGDRQCNEYWQHIHIQTV